jgi:hypothetical protein
MALKIFEYGAFFVVTEVKRQNVAVECFVFECLFDVFRYDAHADGVFVTAVNDAGYKAL